MSTAGDATLHHAIRDLAAPRLFENRLCFRLLGLDWTQPRMRFGQMGFFDAVDQLRLVTCVEIIKVYS